LAGTIAASAAGMSPDDVKARSMKFAVEVIRFCRRLPSTEESRVVSRQLLRAGTGVGANYRAVCRSRSDAEFIAKLGTVIEESDESAYWLELLVEAEIVKRAAIQPLHEEAESLTRMMVASRQTVRLRMRARRKDRNQKSKIQNQK
jgi:four helix bundle protein